MQTNYSTGLFAWRLSPIISTFMLLLFTAASCAFSQTSVGASLTGTITDPSGAAVSGAKSVLTNTESGTSQTVESNETGGFVFGRIVPGRYSLDVEKSGFRRVARQGLVVAVNETATADIQLQLGEVTNTVSVNANVSILQSQTVELSSLVDERRVRELPLNGKNFNRLTLLAPGVGGGDYNNPAISGARPTANTYAIDGVNTSDERSTGGISVDGGAGSSTYGGLGPNLISTEAIQEFRVITTNADATFGRGSGGQINIITKSGGNVYHGSAYEYFRNSALDARNFFNYGPFLDSQGRAKVPPFRQNLFGGTFGGAIKKNKHFFFGNYEGFRQRLKQSSTALLPNADLINLIPGDLGRYYRTFYIDRGIVPSTGNAPGTFSPLSSSVRSAAIAARFPAALFDGNPANGEAGTVQASTSPTRNIDQDQFLIRTDHHFSDKLNVNVRYGFAQPQLTSASAAAPIDVSFDHRRWQSGEVSAVYTISPSQFLDLRGGVLRSSYITGSQAGADPRLLQLGVSPELGVAFIYDTGLAAPSTGAHNGFIDNQTIPQAALLHTWSKGKFTLRSGLDIRRLDLNVANVAGAQPIYTYNGYVGRGSLLGDSYGQTQSIAGSARLIAFGVGGGVTGAIRGWRDTQQEYFSTLDWRVRRDLTFNLGLRYSNFGVYDEVNGVASNLYATDASGTIVPSVTPFQYGRQNNVLAAVAPGRPLYQPDHNNAAPRLGVSYDFLGKGATILRAGFGVYYDRISQIVFSNNISNAPQALSSSVSFTPFVIGGTVPLSGSVPTATGIDPTFRNPYTKRFNAAVEQRVDSATSITVAYVGARGRSLLKGLEPDAGPAVPQALRPDPRFSDQRIYGNGGFSNYDALQVYAQRRFRGGAQFSVAYTYSSSKDNTSVDRDFGRTRSLLNLGANPSLSGFQGGGGSQFVPLPAYADYGYSDFDVRHYFTFSHVVDVPLGRGKPFLNNSNAFVNGLVSGWSVAGVGVLRTGEPFSVILGSDIYSIGDTSTSRPALSTGTLSDLYASGAARTQYLVPRTTALSRLTTPLPITDPSVAIPRNSLQSPNVLNYDLSVLRQFRLTERVGLRFEANAFNVFNRAQFAAPTANLSSSLFGLVTSTRAGSTPRQIQLGLKLSF